MRRDARVDRLIARSLIVFAALLFPLVLFLWVAAPGSPAVPMFQPTILGFTYDIACGVAGLGGMLLGLAWMIRIYRTDPEPDQGAWRYRDF